MTDRVPTILATSGGMTDRHPRLQLAFAPLIDFAFELSGAAGTPKFCHVATASGDPLHQAARVDEAGRAAGVSVSHLTVFPMPNHADMLGHLLDCDVVWVNGGSVANLLAVWRVHGLDDVFRQVWQAGVVLGGVSAGSICWHVGGTTDSFGPELRPVTNGLGFLPFSNGVHYDSEEQRRPLFQSLVADGTLPDGYATDDGAGLVYRGTEMVEAVTERRTARAWSVTRSAGSRTRGTGGGVVEEAVPTRVLPGAG